MNRNYGELGVFWAGAFIVFAFDLIFYGGNVVPLKLDPQLMYYTLLTLSLTLFLAGVIELRFTQLGVALAALNVSRPPSSLNTSGARGTMGSEAFPSPPQRSSAQKHIPARVLIGILSLVLIGLGLGVMPTSSESGFTIVSWGGGVFLTYLVVDFLLLREDRNNWKLVKEKVSTVIRSELGGVRVDTFLFSGSQDVVISIPEGITREAEQALFADAHLTEARRLSANPEALRQKGVQNIGNARGLFGRRAESLVSFQNRYWSRLLEPNLMAYLVDLEGKLRLVDTCLNIYLNYNSAAEPPAVEGIQSLRTYLVDSSREALFQSMQQLLALVANGIDSGIVPKD